VKIVVVSKIHLTIRSIILVTTIARLGFLLSDLHIETKDRSNQENVETHDMTDYMIH
jgi:hypothetical protein